MPHHVRGGTTGGWVGPVGLRAEAFRGAEAYASIAYASIAYASDGPSLNGYRLAHS